jgi:hypothetical protein
MPVVSIRLDEDLYRLLRDRAYRSDLTFSQFLRPAIEQAVMPGTSRAVSGLDEVLGILIQTFALVSIMAADQSPETCRKGLEEARKLLAERGLIDAPAS